MNDGLLNLFCTVCLQPSASQKLKFTQAGTQYNKGIFLILRSKQCDKNMYAFILTSFKILCDTSKAHDS